MNSVLRVLGRWALLSLFLSTFSISAFTQSPKFQWVGSTEPHLQNPYAMAVDDSLFFILANGGLFVERSTPEGDVDRLAWYRSTSNPLSIDISGDSILVSGFNYGIALFEHHGEGHLELLSTVTCNGSARFFHGGVLVLDDFELHYYTIEGFFEDGEPVCGVEPLGHITQFFIDGRFVITCTPQVRIRLMEFVNGSEFVERAWYVAAWQGGIVSMFLHGLDLYVQDYQAGIHKISFQNWPNPEEIGFLPSVGGNNMMLLGNTLVLLEDNTIRLMDITSFSEAEEIGRIMNVTGSAMVCNEHFLLVADELGESSTKGYRLFSIEDQAHPELITLRGSPDKLYCCAANDDFLYVIEEDYGLRVFDLSFPDQPVETSSLERGAEYWGFKPLLKRNYLVLSESQGEEVLGIVIYRVNGGQIQEQYASIPSPDFLRMNGGYEIVNDFFIIWSEGIPIRLFHLGDENIDELDPLEYGFEDRNLFGITAYENRIVVMYALEESAQYRYDILEMDDEGQVERIGTFSRDTVGLNRTVFMNMVARSDHLLLVASTSKVIDLTDPVSPTVLSEFQGSTATRSGFEPLMTEDGSLMVMRGHLASGARLASFSLNDMEGSTCPVYAYSQAREYALWEDRLYVCNGFNIDIFQYFNEDAGDEQETISVSPSSWQLHQAVPNPFNPTTTIRFDLRIASRVQLTVYDVLGREVARLVDRPMVAGEHQVMFNGTGYSSGMYFCHLEASDFRQTRKLLLVK